MAIKILAACLTFCVLASQGAVIREEEDVLFTAMQTLLSEPEKLVDSFGMTRDKRHAQGAWDFDKSFGGVTLQIKYKDAANRWKGGHAHFEVQDLKKIVPAARSRHVSLNIDFDGGAAKRDFIFNLKVEYSLQHGFEEKGIFTFNRKQVGGEWITELSNKKNGGGNGNRIFPLMEHTAKTDRATMWEGTYNSGRFSNVKADIKRVPGSKVDGTLSGNFLGTDVKVTLHGTRNSATNKLDGKLTVEVGRKKYDFKIDGKRIPGSDLDVILTGDIEGKALRIEFDAKRDGAWKKPEGTLKINFGPMAYELLLKLDRSAGMKLKLVANVMGQKYEVDYRRASDWTKIDFMVKGMGSKMVDIKIKRKVTSTFNRKAQISLNGAVFGADTGKITLQVKEVDGNTKEFSVIADRTGSNPEKEVLKYVNTISVKKGVHGGHNELDMTMKAHLDLKESSKIHKALCGGADGHNSIHCFNSRYADVSLELNVDEPWHLLFLAKLNKDGKNVLDAKIDTKSHHMSSPYVFKITAPRILPAAIEAEAKYVGKNIEAVLKVDGAQKFKVDLNSPDGKSPYEANFAFAGLTYKVVIVHEDKNGDGDKDFFDVKVFKNGPKVFDFEVDSSSWPHKFMLEYPATLSFIHHAPGKIEGTHGKGTLHFHYKPGKGKDLEIDVKRTLKESGKHTRDLSVKVKRAGQVYYDYESHISYGPFGDATLEFDANSKMTVSSSSLLHNVACAMPSLDFLCFSERTMLTKFRAPKSAPYKMNAHVEVKKDGAEVFKIDLNTKKSPYKLIFNWPRLRAIVAPYRNEALEITADHKPGQSLAVTSNIKFFKQFSVEKMPNGLRKVTLNGKELVQADFKKGDKSITQITTLPNGKTLKTTVKWGNEDKFEDNSLQLILDGSERQLDATLKWWKAGGEFNWKLDAVGNNARWGNYNIHREGSVSGGAKPELKIKGNSLWKGNKVQTNVYIMLDTSLVGNGKLDAITAKLTKIVDGKTYEINVTDGKFAPGDFVKVVAFVRDLAA
jgi:uncharacterized protein (DUF2249 family)